MEQEIKKEVPKINNPELNGLNLIPFRDLGDKFRAKLRLHKLFINNLIKTREEKIIPAIISSGEELALVYANFKCEKCGNEENLQSHHMIQKNIRPFINSTKYIIQRFYWANMVILCNKCHAEFHKFNKDKFILESLCIQKQKINKLKKLYKNNNSDEDLEINN
jgi:predicted RNA-binding Zn-ribbon protein involved in translation (DUF1610 family)